MIIDPKERKGDTSFYSTSQLKQNTTGHGIIWTLISFNWRPAFPPVSKILLLLLLLGRRRSLKITAEYLHYPPLSSRKIQRHRSCLAFWLCYFCSFFLSFFLRSSIGGVAYDCVITRVTSLEPETDYSDTACSLSVWYGLQKHAWSLTAFGIQRLQRFSLHSTCVVRYPVISAAFYLHDAVSCHIGCVLPAWYGTCHIDCVLPVWYDILSYRLRFTCVIR